MKTPMVPSRQLTLCYLVIPVFFVLLWAPFLQMFLHVAPEVSLDENRRLAPLPTLKKLSFDDTEFQKAFEEYYTDHFGFRNTLIFCNNYIKASQLNVSPHPNVSIGKNGWYYFDLPSQGIVFKDYMGLVRYDSAKLSRLADNLDMIHTKIEKAGILLVLVVVPDKQTIYPEYMSDSVPKRRSRTRLDQVLEYLQEKKPHLLIVDPRADLIRAKSTLSQALYYKADTHWNKYGAFVAYRKMMEVLSGLVPVIKALALDDYSITHQVFPGGDIVKMISMEGGISDNDWVFELKKPVTLNVFDPGYQKEPNSISSPLGLEQKNRALPRLLMYCDSFAVSLIPFLAPHFSRSVFVWSNIIDSAHISAEKPDIVVLEIIERNLDFLLEEKYIFR
jgi:hypothetical protein